MEKIIKGLYSFASSSVQIVEYSTGEWKISVTEPLMLSRDSFKEVMAIAYNADVFYLTVKRMNQVGYNMLRVSSDGSVIPIGPILSQGSGELVVTGNTTVMYAREMDYTFPEQVILAEGREEFTEEIPPELANKSKVWGEVVGVPFFMKPVASTSNVFYKETSYAEDATDFIYTDKKEKRKWGTRKPFKFKKLKGWEIADISLNLGWFIAKKESIHFLYHFSNPLPIKGPCKFMEFRIVDELHIVLSVYDPTTELFRQYTLLADATFRPYIEEDCLDDACFPVLGTPHMLTLCNGDVLRVTLEQADFIQYMLNAKKRETSPQQKSVFQQILKDSIVVWSPIYGFVHGFGLKRVKTNKGSVQFEKRVATNVAIFSLGTSLYLRYAGSSVSYNENDAEFLGGSIVQLDEESGTMELYYGDESFQIALEKVEHDDEDESDFISQYGITVKENAIVIEAYDKVILDTGKIVSLQDIQEEADNWLLLEIN